MALDNLLIIHILNCVFSFFFLSLPRFLTFVTPASLSLFDLLLDIQAGTFGASLEYGIEERITAYSSLGATMVVGKS